MRYFKFNIQYIQNSIYLYQITIHKQGFANFWGEEKGVGQSYTEALHTTFLGAWDGGS